MKTTEKNVIEDRVNTHMALKLLYDEQAKRDEKITHFAEKATEEFKTHGKSISDAESALRTLTEASMEGFDRIAVLEQKLAAYRGAGAPDAVKSVGQQLTDSDDFKSLQTKGRGQATIAVKANNLTSLTTDAAGSVGDAVQPMRLPGIQAPAERVLTIRDVLLSGRTATSSIEDVRETGNDFTAAPVAEGSPATQSDIKLDLFTSPIRLLSHFMVASVQVLSDIPMLQSYVNSRLLYGLDRVIENHLISGPGTGQNLTGLTKHAAPFDASTYMRNGDTEIDVIRRAALQVRVAELKAGFVVLHPVSWANIELMKSDEDSHYIQGVNLETGRAPRLWGLNVIETTALQYENQFIVGSTQGATVFDREESNVTVSTEHSDFFVKGLVALKATSRLGLVVHRPSAFVYGDWGGSPSINV